jgi:2-polyprenyl-6-methoxyphenol hydroxylase-like FAD-dependent oxidoreductase
MAELSVAEQSYGSGRRVAIVVGAGIAGLAMAHGLTRLGYRVRILEREAELRTEGAGLSLWPNAVRAMRELRCEDVLLDCSCQIAEGATLKPSGKVIASAPLDLIEQRYGPLHTVHRGDLLEALVAHAGVPIEFGAAVSCVDGTLLLGEEILSADLIVGADGIASTVREAVSPGVEPRPAGYGAWRGIAPLGGVAPAGASETLGRGRRFGLVPLSGERTYWFAVLEEDAATAELEGEFADWHEPIGTLLAATPPSRRFYLDLADLPRLPRWHRGHTVLLGDAAHAMTPNLGQGAAQALIDVATLVRELRSGPLEEALTAYERQRKRPAERIVRQSRAVGRMAQLSNPLSARIRDAISSRAPSAIVARQMGRVLDA